MGLAVSGMHYTGMAALSVHLHGGPGSPAGDSPASLLAPLMIGPLVFLCLAGVVVMFDPLMVAGGSGRPPVEHRRPGVPAHPPAVDALDAGLRRTLARPGQRTAPRGHRTPQNR